MYPFISIIIPNWNGKIDTLECLKSLSELDYPKEQIEVIVVDNGSSDGSQPAIKEKVQSMINEKWRKLKLIELPENVGIPEAYNIGFRNSGKEVYALLRLDNDVELKKDCLQRLVLRLRSDNRIGIVGCQNFTWSDHKKRCGGAAYCNLCTGRFKRLYPNKSVACDGVQGNCMLVRVAAVEDVDYLFDKTLFAMGDETELSFRLNRMGYITVYEPSAICYHKEGRSTTKIPKLIQYYSVRNGVLLHRRYNQYPQKAVWYLFMFLYAVKSLLSGKLTTLRAIRDGFLFRLQNIKS